MKCRKKSKLRCYLFCILHYQLMILWVCLEKNGLPAIKNMSPCTSLRIPFWGKVDLQVL